MINANVRQAATMSSRTNREKYRKLGLTQMAIAAASAPVRPS